MGLLDILGRIGHGAGGVLEGAGRGVLGGLEDVGRGLIGQQQQGQIFAGMTPEQLKQFIPDDAMRTAFMNQAMPTTQAMLGPVGKIPVLGPVLGGGLDLLSTLQAARHGGLGRELAYRGAAGAIPFSNLQEMAQARYNILQGQTEQKRGTLLDTQTAGVARDTTRQDEEAAVRNRLNEAHIAFTQGAQTDAARAQAQKDYMGAWREWQTGVAAGRYSGELPPGFDPSVPGNVLTKENKVFIKDPAGNYMYLPNAPAPGKPGAGEKPPPMGVRTLEDANAYAASLPPEAHPRVREAPGRPGYYMVDQTPLDTGALGRRTKAIATFQEWMPTRGPGGIKLYGGTAIGKDPILRQQAQGVLQQITGRPISVDEITDDEGYPDPAKLDATIKKYERRQENTTLMLNGGGGP